MMDKISSKSSNPLATMGRAEASRKQSKPAVQDDQRDSDPAFAENLAGAQSVAPAPAQPAPVKMSGEGEKGNSQSGNPGPGNSGGEALLSMEAKRIGPKSTQALFDRPGQGAEASPRTLAAAVSTNTAAAIAGPTPWGKEWVFAGSERNPDIKPLIAEKTPMAAQVLQEVEMRKGGEAAGAPGEKQPVGLMQAMQELAQAKSALDAARAAGDDPEAMMSPATAKVSNASANNPMEALAAQHEQSRIAQAMAGEGGGDDFDAAGLKGAELLETQALPAHQPTLKTAGPVAQANLSGGEYLSTLAALKGMQQHGRQDQSNLMGGDSQQGRESGLEMAGTKLKMIDGGIKKGAMNSSNSGDEFGGNLMLAGAHSNPMLNGSGHVAAPVVATDVAGHVVKGAGSQDRLSSESLINISQSVKNFTPSGGGEMRVRLRPDNLGELHVKVVTEGNRVGLQIQASNEHAKKVLEESISHLKTSLASQQLSLAQVDVTVAKPTHSAGHGGDFHQDPNGQQNQHAFGDMLGQNRNPNSSGEGWAQRGNESIWRDPEVNAPRSASLLRAAQSWDADRLAGGSRRVVGDSGRLDVRA